MAYAGGDAGAVDAMVCPYCRDPKGDIVEDYVAGNITCRDCGSVLEASYVTHDAEWREYTQEESAPDLSRAEVAQGPLRQSLGTMVGKLPTGGAQASTVARTHAKVVGSAAAVRTSNHAKAVKSLCDSIALTRNARDVALSFFARLCEKSTVKKPAVPAAAAACVYAACRRVGAPRSIREIAAASSANQRRIGKVFLHVKRVLDLRLEAASHADFVFGFAKELDLPFHLASQASSICTQCTDSLPSSRTPAAVSAVALHLAAELSPDQSHRRTLAACAKAARVSDQTAQATLRDVLSVRRRVIPRAVLRAAAEHGVNAERVLAAMAEGS